MSDYKEKLCRAFDELGVLGFKQSHTLPIGFSIARKLGLQPRPLPYMSNTSQFIYYSMGFGLTMNGYICLLHWWLCRPVGSIVVLGMCILGGFAFAAFVLLWERLFGEKKAVTSWNEL